MERYLAVASTLLLRARLDFFFLDNLRTALREAAGDAELRRHLARQSSFISSHIEFIGNRYFFWRIGRTGAYVLVMVNFENDISPRQIFLHSRVILIFLQVGTRSVSSGRLNFEQSFTDKFREQPRIENHRDIFYFPFLAPSRRAPDLDERSFKVRVALFSSADPNNADLDHDTPCVSRLAGALLLWK